MDTMAKRWFVACFVLWALATHAIYWPVMLGQLAHSRLLSRLLFRR